MTRAIFKIIEFFREIVEQIVEKAKIVLKKKGKFILYCILITKYYELNCGNSGHTMEGDFNERTTNWNQGWISCRK